MSWSIVLVPEAEEELGKLDGSIRGEIAKGMLKVSENLEYPNGYGKPLGNHTDSALAGLYKIKFKRAGIRVIYSLKREGQNMFIIIISARADDHVYHEAVKRRIKYDM